MSHQVSVAKKCKRLVRSMLGRVPVWRPDIHLDTVYYGSDWGGWEIVPSLVRSDSIVYSFGLGIDISWDTEMIGRHGVTVHGFDPTPSQHNYFEEHPYGPGFIFHSYGLDGQDREVEIRSQLKEKLTSGTILDRSQLDVDTTGPTIQVKRLATIMSELGHDHIDVLKIDIEGAEYSAVPDFLNAGIRPAQFMMETHRYVTDGPRLERECFKALREADYLLYDISASEGEFGFIHRSAVAGAASRQASFSMR